MDIHKANLLWLCRLCSKTLEKDNKNWQSKLALKTWISKSFEIDITLDVDTIHPPNVCTSCRLKLSRCHQKRKPKESGIILKTFSQHDSSCTICSQVWDLRLIKTICEEQGFSAWVKRDKCTAIILSDFGETVLKRVLFGQNDWDVFVLGRQISTPVEVSVDKIRCLLSLVNLSAICCGNVGFDHVNVVYAKKGFRSVSGDVVATIENSFYDGQDIIWEKTVRHCNCTGIVSDDTTVGITNYAICAPCKEFRNNLSSTESRLRKLQAQSKTTSKYVRYDFLSQTQLRTKVKQLTTEQKQSTKRENKLKNTIAEMMNKESLIFAEDKSKNIGDIVQESSAALEALLEPNSACKLLWEEQKKALRLQSKKHMRWHPALIRWAIALNSKSSSAYRLVRDSGFLLLPHPRTLYTYTHFTQPKVGINADMLLRLYNDFKVKEMKEHEKYVSLMIDEMKVKEGLIYSRSSEKLVGFVDVGNIQTEMTLFEERCAGEQDSTDSHLASHVLVFMVRGLTSSIKFPVAYFPTQNVKGIQLVPLVWKCVRALKVIGLTVKCLVSDGASSNRKLYNILSSEEFYGINVYEASTSKLYFVCDAPHLIKTTRNNIENSQWNKKSRNLIYKGNYIAWPQLVRLYEKDQGFDRATPGLRRLPKLRHEHLFLTPSLRMKVNLAAQVLSSSVANAIKASEEPGLSSTVEFIEKFDYFFDCLNVRSLHEWERKKKDSLKPYTSVEDDRFQWLIQNFLGFLKKWEDEVAAVPGLSAAERKRMKLSRETTDGLRITVNAFVNMAKEILNLPGVTYFLSEKINQDPLEEFFSKQRGAGGFHDNPSVEQFGHHLLENVAAGSSARGSRRANVRGSSQSTTMSDEPLPKRKRTTKAKMN